MGERNMMEEYNEKSSYSLAVSSLPSGERIFAPPVTVSMGKIQNDKEQLETSNLLKTDDARSRIMPKIPSILKK